jgi:ADP-ribosylarginine hydrolase
MSHYNTFITTSSFNIHSSNSTSVTSSSDTQIIDTTITSNSTSATITDEKIQLLASIYLAIVGDKIGFGNAEREKNYLPKPILVENNPSYEDFSANLSHMMIFRFIAEGGIMGLDLENLTYSDDTIMHLATIRGFIVEYSSRDQLYQNVANEYLNDYPELKLDKYLSGRQTLEALKNIQEGINWRNFSYSKSAGGSGGPMRTMIVGLIFNREQDLLKLIEYSIMICSITHPNTTAFIGSIASALFTSYAFRKINIESWIFEFVRLLESDRIDNIIERIKPSYIEFFSEDKKMYLHKLATYIETSFDDYSYIISERSTRSTYSSARFNYYFDNFAHNKKIMSPGSGADDCIIIAYDCLLMSKSNYEKLIYTSMINIGDSDTLGSIASAWYGALYGFKNVPHNLFMDNNSDYDVIKSFADVIHKKYFSNENRNLIKNY